MVLGLHKEKIVLQTGGCLCGAVRFEVRAEPIFVCICHCHSCRKATGGAMVPWATFHLSDVNFTQGALEDRASSAGVTRGHCPRCGTGISYRHELRPGEIDLTLAGMDDATVFAPTAHIWVEDKLPWIVIGDDLPQYQKTVSDV